MHDKIENFSGTLRDLKIDYWLAQDLFSGHWWFILILNGIFLYLFFSIIDRGRMRLIVIAFLLAFTLISYVNELGHFLGLWDYPHQFIIFFQSFNAVDFAVVPVIITLNYQFISRWKAYMISSLLISAIISFIGLPLFIYFGFYEIHHWNTFYSFLVLFFASCMIKLLTDFIENRAKQYR